MIKKINGMLVVAVALSTLSIGATDVVAAVETGWKKNALKAAGVVGGAAAILLLVAAYKRSVTKGQRLGHGPVVVQDPVITKSVFDAELDAKLKRTLGDMNTNLRNEIAQLRNIIAAKADNAAVNGRLAIIESNYVTSTLVNKKIEKQAEITNGNIDALGVQVAALQESAKARAMRRANLSLEADMEKKRKADVEQSAPLAEEIAVHVSASAEVSAPAVQAEAAHA